MIVYRRSEERGHADKGWLDSFHTFSFADYQDPNHNGFRSLRVLNEDRVAAAKGFGAHGHRDMEIISYVVSGKLGHKDSMGHEEVLGANEIQVMSAGTGVVHSEFNASKTKPVHFLQIWIEPASKGFVSNYQQLALTLPKSWVVGGFSLSEPAVTTQRSCSRTLPSRSPNLHPVKRGLTRCNRIATPGSRSFPARCCSMATR